MGGWSVCRPGLWGQDWQVSHEHKLYLPVSGAAWYEVPGHRQHLSLTEVVLIPGGRPHRFGCSRIWRLHFLHFLVDDPITELRLASLVGFLVWPRNELAWWQATWQRLDDYPANRSPGLDAKLTALVDWLLADADERGWLPTVDHGRLQRLLPALRLLAEAPEEHPPVSHLAAACNLSPAHFHRLFRTAIGVTPQRWLDGRLMQRARQLLLTSDENVAAIGARLGFADPGYFNRRCRRAFGCSPGRLRRRCAP